MSTEERQKITLDDKEYYIDSFSEEAKQYLNDISLVQQEIAKLSVQTGIANIAKTTLSNKLLALKDTFEEVK